MIEITKCVETAPELIWLNVSDEDGDWDEEFENYEDVMWSPEQGDGPALRVGVKYRRDDLVPQWISVEERLPEESDSYLIWVERLGVWVAEYDKGEGRWVGIGYHNPRHWMPLPQPPKEEK